MADKNPSFAIKPDDPKDVSWGLTTADACWRRGERRDALRWLRRAVEAASEAEADERALELAKIAADLATQIGATVAPPAPAPAPAAGAPVVPAAPALPAIPRAAAVPKPLVGRAGAPMAPRAPVAKDPPKKADRKSITNEGPRSRAGHALGGKAQDKASGHEKAPPEKAEAIEAPPPSMRKRSTSKVDRGEAAQRPNRTDEIDQWPTEVGARRGGIAAPLAAEDATTLTPMTAPTGAAPAAEALAGIVAAQAVRVIVWREPTGIVHVIAAGTGRPVPADALEATLVAADAAADLVTLLRE